MKLHRAAHSSNGGRRYPCLLGVALHAQGRGGSEWTTSGFDAQRTGWVRTDPRISPQTMVKPGEFGAFKFLWKLKLEHDPKAATALTAPVLLDRIIGFRGFKSVAFVAHAVRDGARGRLRLRHHAVEVPHQLHREPAAGHAQHA